MPFSSLTDPVDLARADGALNAAWAELQWMTPEPLGERERTRLAYIIAALVAVPEDEDDLRRRARLIDIARATEAIRNQFTAPLVRPKHVAVPRRRWRAACRNIDS